MFDSIKNYAEDDIEALYLRAQADRRAEALNLGIGVYRNDQGEAPVFDCVRTAEKRLAEQSHSKSYMTPFGNQAYIQQVEKLIYGADSDLVTKDRLISAQCPGAGGGLRIGAELIQSINKSVTAWFPEPVWSHQIDFFRTAGIPIERYAYYDVEKQQLDFGRILESMRDLSPGDLVIIHACCHNPTGADLSLEQWAALTDFLQEKQAVPFVDIAYQGYGQSIAEDVAGMQLMAERMDEMLVTLSSSKSFAMYRERVGLFSLIHKNNISEKDSLRRYVRDAIRGIYFMPPDHGAAVIAEVLTDPELNHSWRQEIDQIRHRIKHCRQMLAHSLEQLMPEKSFDYLRQQKGMFSCLTLDSQQLDLLEKEYAIYLLPNGRINFAAMNEKDVARIAEAISSVL